MLILSGVQDIFALPEGPQDAVCVTTNGCIRRDGRAVMGRGIALTADRKFNLAPTLAGYLKLYGNRPFYMGVHTDPDTGRTMSVLTFPTKHDWRNPSDPALIEYSARCLVPTVEKFGIRRCFLTCPGCANGGLDWTTQVYPVIAPILDDRFVIADSRLG